MDFILTDENGNTFVWNEKFATLDFNDRLYTEELSPEANTFISMLVTMVKKRDQELFKGVCCDREFIDYDG